MSNFPPSTASDLLAFQRRLATLTTPVSGLAGDFIAVGANLPAASSPAPSLSLWLLDGSDLKEVVRTAPAPPVSGLRPWVGGCIFWRDHVYTLMDMVKVFTEQRLAPLPSPLPTPSPATPPGPALDLTLESSSPLSTLASGTPSSVPWVTILDNHFNVDLALQWDAFFGTLARSSLTLLPASPSAKIHPWIRRRWQDAGARVWHELSLEKLVFSPLFDSVRAS